jgi:hypothetical protein
MAEDHGVFYDEVPDRAVLPVVYVGTADAGVVYCYEDIVLGLESRDGTVCEGDIVWFVEDEGEVLFSLVRFVCLFLPPFFLHCIAGALEGFARRLARTLAVLGSAIVLDLYGLPGETAMRYINLSCVFCSICIFLGGPRLLQRSEKMSG